MSFVFGLVTGIALAASLLTISVVWPATTGEWPWRSGAGAGLTIGLGPAASSHSLPLPHAAARTGMGMDEGAGAGAGAESERPLIFVYPLPDRLYLSDVSPSFREDDLNAGWRTCYATEWVVLQAWERQGLITGDPAQAAFFVVPHIATMVFHDRMSKGMPNYVARPIAAAYLRAIVSHVQQAYPFWNASGGHDHVFIFGQDRALDWITMSDPALHLDVFPLIRNATFLLNDGDMGSRWYDSGRDVLSMPVQVSQRPVDEPVSADLAPFPSLLGFFVGGMHGRHRREIARAAADDKDLIVREGTVPNYSVLLRNSRFCLHLPGFEGGAWSQRLVSIVQAGCVPAVIIDNLALPFERVQDWRHFSLRIPEALALQPHALANRLREVSEPAWRNLRRRLLQLRPLLLYRFPSLRWLPSSRDVSDVRALDDQDGSHGVDAAFVSYLELLAHMRKRALLTQRTLAAVRLNVNLMRAAAALLPADEQPIAFWS
jgi:hypothetical protein